MPIGVVLIALWWAAVVLYLVWQFATDALAAPVPDEVGAVAPVEDGWLADAVTCVRPAGTVSGAGIAG
jgi:hypothetical protein